MTPKFLPAAVRSLDAVGVLGVLLTLATLAAPPSVDGQTPDREPPTRERPSFTPFTVAPRLLNTEEVSAALVRAYPPDLREAGIGGRVNVWFYLDEEGTVDNALINQSSGLEALDQAALDVASVYRFSPAMNRENRVAVWISLPVTFQVQGPAPTN